MKKIKIFCTLGPSTLNKKFLRFAQRNRIDLVRLNMSHLSAKNLEKNIKFIKANSNLNICIDTEGAQIRTKTEKKILLQKNQKLTIFRHKKIHFYPEEVFHKLKKNDILEIGFDGLIIKVTKKLKDRIQANCIRGGTLEKNKGVHLSNRNINLSFLTSKDFAAIKLGKKYKIKNYALSFTNTCNDILKFSKLLPFENKIYKIETNKAVKTLILLTKWQMIFLLTGETCQRRFQLKKYQKRKD